MHQSQTGFLRLFLILTVIFFLLSARDVFTRECENHAGESLIVGRSKSTGAGTRVADRVLVCTTGGDRTNTLIGHLQGQNIPFTTENPATTIQHTAEFLFDRYYAIYTGCQGDICENAMKTMINGGIIEDYVSRGGIFVANSAHNCGYDITGPRGSKFGSYQQSGTTDENPSVADNDHEWITGHGFGGNQLNANNFRNWGTSCHGHVSAPPQMEDSAGENLGTSPKSGFWNDILWSPANQKPALVEYVLDEGYVMMNLMTFDWGGRGNNELLQMVKYIETIKDNFPTCRPPEPDSVTLLDPSKADLTCYSMYQPYTIGVNVSTFEFINDLSDIRLFVDYNNTNITLGFNGTEKQFYKENDDDEIIQLLDGCTFSSDGIEKWWINFSIMLSFDFPHEDLVDVFANTTSSSGDFCIDRFPWVFKVENDLEFLGEPRAAGEYQDELEAGDWVRADELLSFSNTTVVYEGAPGIFPDDGYFDVKVADRHGNAAWDNHSSGREIYMELRSGNATDIEEYYAFSIINIPDSGQCVSYPTYSLKLDGDAPPPPLNLVCHADSFKDRETGFTDGRESFLTWDAAEDHESGLLGYYVSDLDNSTTENGSFLNDTEFHMADLDEGYANAYVWCVDRVGNIGSASHSRILVDMSSPVFSDITPDDGVWHNVSRIHCTVEISDPEGSGVDGNTIEYSVSNSDDNGFDQWIQAWIPEVSGSLSAYVDHDFSEGEENYIKWRARDIAGNPYSETDAVNIKVDRTSIVFGETPVNGKNWHSGNEVTTTVIVTDGGSGVSRDRLQASVSTSGPSGFGEWFPLAAKDIQGDDDTALTVSVTGEFPEGKDNYVRFRGTDVAGTPVSVSKSFNIAVDTTPVYFTGFSPEDGEILDERDVECFISILDNGSGVDPATVEYSVSSKGADPDDFDEWKKATGIVPGNPVQVTMELEFDWGADNYIRFRANDGIGTGLTISCPYLVWVNSKPTAAISGVANGAEVEKGEEIILNASASWDEDGDDLLFYWSSNRSENRSLGHGPVLRARLASGNHTITLYANDGHGYNVTAKITVNIGRKKEKDDDEEVDEPILGEGGDGLLFLYLILGIVPLLLILLVLLLLVRRKRKRDREEEARRSQAASRLPGPASHPYMQGGHCIPGIPSQYAAPGGQLPGHTGRGRIPPQPFTSHGARPPLQLPPASRSSMQSLGGGPGQQAPVGGQLPPPMALNYALPQFSTDSGTQNLNLMALPPAPESVTPPIPSSGGTAAIAAKTPSSPALRPVSVVPEISSVFGGLGSPGDIPPTGPKYNALGELEAFLSVMGGPDAPEPPAGTAVEPLSKPSMGTSEASLSEPPVGTPVVPLSEPPVGTPVAPLSEPSVETAVGPDVGEMPVPPDESPPIPPEPGPDPPGNEPMRLNLQCHACGNGYAAEISGFPATVTCPFCGTGGMIESL